MKRKKGGEKNGTTGESVSGTNQRNGSEEEENEEKERGVRENRLEIKLRKRKWKRREE